MPWEAPYGGVLLAGKSLPEGQDGVYGRLPQSVVLQAENPGRLGPINDDAWLLLGLVRCPRRDIRYACRAQLIIYFDETSEAVPSTITSSFQ